ncbi:stress-responsive transcription factor hsf1 [Mortierella antarctica]|nr:stress-responsive transcription factor hsf1 [Mortierella antarctica]
MNNKHPRIVELPSSSSSNSFVQDMANNNVIINNNGAGSNTASPIITTPDTAQDTLAFLNTPPSSSNIHHDSTSSMTDLMSPETRSALALINASHTANSIAAGSRSNMSPLTGLASSSGHINGGGAASSSSVAAALPLPSSSSRGSSSSSSALQPRSSNNSGRGTVAAFLTKLYNMVGDKASNNLIKWSDDGQSFIVINHVEFAKEVLPKFFKHNNFSSFVRQLNMYGFHKVPHLQQGVLMPDADSEQWEFSNPHFQKNQPDLLYLVSRKKASNGAEDKDALTMDLGHILSEVTAIKRHQVAISSDLKNIERDHQSLWQESLAARERHQRQQETIDKILRFLASVFSGEKKRAIVPNKKPRLTITEGGGHQGSTGSSGMVLEEDDDEGHDDYEEDLHRSNANFSQLHEDHEEEMSRLLGVAGANNGKRNHTTMTGPATDFVLPGAKSSLSEITPGVNSNIGVMANATKKTSPKAAKGKATTSSNTASKVGKLPLTTNATTATNRNNNNNNTATSSSGRLSTISAATTTTNPSLPPTSTGLPLEYLNSFPGMGNYLNQPSLKLDPSTLANLSIPTTLLPPNAITPAHYDMLRTISMANAQDATANPVAPLPPPLFIQTPAGASVTKGVDQITMEMEQLQKNIEALQQHGLNVNDLNFDDDGYMTLGDHYGTTDFTNHDDFDYSALNDDTATNTNVSASMPTASTATTSVGTNPRISTVGEEEYLEGLLNLDHHS